MWVNNALNKEQSKLFAGYELLAANCNSQKKPGSRCRGSCWTCWLSPPVSYSKHICSALLCMKMERMYLNLHLFPYDFSNVATGGKVPGKTSLDGTSIRRWKGRGRVRSCRMTNGFGVYFGNDD